VLNKAAGWVASRIVFLLLLTLGLRSDRGHWTLWRYGASRRRAFRSADGVLFKKPITR